MLDNPFPLYFDRSGLEAHAACPRLYWWTREWGKHSPQFKAPHCGGLAPAGQSIYTALGGAVHEGLGTILCAAIGEIPGSRWQSVVDHAIEVALEEFNVAAASPLSIPDATTPEQRAWKLREARALIEGLVLVAGLRLIPNLLERFDVVEVERERRFQLGIIRKDKVDYIPGQIIEGTPFSRFSEHQISIASEQPLILETTADALLRERETGDLYVHSWKTAGDYGRQEEMQFRHDVQGLSEAIALEETTQIGNNSVIPAGSAENRTWNVRIQGIQMAFLLKGRKSRDSAGDGEFVDSSSWHGLGPGMRYHFSPITHGWRQMSAGILPDDDLTRWAWSNKTIKPENKSGFGKLGKGWEEVAVFDAYPSGTRQWVLDLLAGRWQPELGDPFEGVVKMPEPWSRSDREMQDWREQTEHRVRAIAEAAPQVRAAFVAEDWDRARHALNRHFPMNRQSCFKFNSTCFCASLCYGPDHVWQEPLEEGFVLRVPHHSLGRE
jgi:hypothetical protein